jgi:hypothetical protein
MTSQQVLRTLDTPAVVSVSRPCHSGGGCVVDVEVVEVEFVVVVIVVVVGLLRVSVGQ